MASKSPTSPTRAPDAECTRSCVTFKFCRCSKAVSKVSVKQFLTATCSRSVALRRKEVSKRACAKRRAKPDNHEKRRAYEALPKVRAAHRLGEQRYRERKAMKSRRSS